MQSDLSSGGNDRIDGKESQEADASSEVSVCLLALNVYSAMWKADVKLEKTRSVIFNALFLAIKVFKAYQLHLCCLSHSTPIGQMLLVAAYHTHPRQEQTSSCF